MGQDIVTGYDVDANPFAPRDPAGDYPVKNGLGQDIIAAAPTLTKVWPTRPDGARVVSRYPVKDGLGNIIVGTGGGGVSLWRDGATATVQNDILDMSTVNYLDVKMGAPITISGSTFSVSGTAATLAKLGLEAKTNVTSYTGCGIFETQIAAADSLTAASSAALLSGAGTTRRLSTSFTAAETFTIGGQTFTAMASGASGNNQFNVTDSLATLIGKIAAATGLTVALGSPIVPTVTGNKSLFRGTAISSY